MCVYEQLAEQADCRFSNLINLKVFLSVVDWQIFVNFKPPLGGVGVHHGVMFSFGSAKVCSPVIFETCFSLEKDIWIAATDYYMYFYIHVIVLFSIDIYSPVNKFYSVIIFSLLINVVILLLNCLVLIVYLYIHFLSLKHYFLYLNISWTLVLHKTPIYMISFQTYTQIFGIDKTFYYATIAYHVGLNAVLGLPHPGPTS